jgi:hypothetical protein
VTDTHIDPQYRPKTNPNERCINGTGSAGVFGDLLCDVPQALAESGFAFMKQTEAKPTFVLFTGDAPPHYLDYTSVEQYTGACACENSPQFPPFPLHFVCDSDPFLLLRNRFPVCFHRAFPLTPSPFFCSRLSLQN